MSWFKPHSLLDIFFEGGLVLKGVSAAFELSAGILLLFLSSDQIKNFALLVTQKELFEDPYDLLAALVNSAASGLANGHGFAVVFLLTHAIIKFIIVFGLLRNKRWAYPFSFITLGLMLSYQFYDLYMKFTYGMFFMTLFGLFILWLIWLEYKKRIKQPVRP